MTRFITTPRRTETVIARWARAIQNAGALWRAARTLDHRFEDADPDHAALQRAAEDVFHASGVGRDPEPSTAPAATAPSADGALRFSRA